MPIGGLFEEYLNAAETGGSVTAQPVDKTYEGDNRPTYIKNKTNITADQYNEFLAELDDLTAQANLNYRQEQLNQRIIDEAQGRQLDLNYNRNIANQQRQEELFVQQTDALLEKYGVPRTFTTDAGSIYRFNPNGKYTKTYDAGPDFGDYLKAAVKVAITTVATAGVGSAVAAGLGAAGIPQGVANVIADVVVSTAASGGDVKQGVISAFAPNGDLAGARQVTDYFPDGLDGLVDVARTVYDAANQDAIPTVDTDFDVTINKDQDESIVVDEDTGDVSVNVPQPTDVVEDADAGGGGGGVSGGNGGGGGGGGASSQTDASTTGDGTDGGSVADSGGATDSPSTQPSTGTTDRGVFNPELPWIYRGDGVFVHGRTGETRTEDVTDYDPYIIGEGYGTGEDPMPTVTGSGEGDTDNEVGIDDLFGNIGNIFDSTVDSDTTITPTIIKKPSTISTGTTERTLPDETGGYNTGTVVLPTETVTKTNTIPTGTTTPTLPVEPPKGTGDGGDDDGGDTTITTTPVVGTVDKPSTITTGTTDRTLPDETGGYGTGDGGGGTTATTPTPVVGTVTKTNTVPVGTTDPTLPDETGGYGTGGGGGNGGGNGNGDGDGEGSGTGAGGLSGGMFGLSGTKEATRPSSFMSSISFAPQLLTPYMPKQSKDYLAELIARLQK